MNPVRSKKSEISADLLQTSRTSYGMKILYGITKSNFGGAQRYVFELATEMKRQGHDVAVICGAGELLVEKLKENGVRVIEVEGLKRDISLVDEFRSFHFIFRTLYEEKPDVFHINSSK